MNETDFEIVFDFTESKICFLKIFLRKLNNKYDSNDADLQNYSPLYSEVALMTFAYISERF